jgi:hypothetical protein
MTRRIVLGVLVVLVLAAGAVMVGGFAYRMGLMQGLAQNPVMVAPDGTPPDGGPGMWYYHGGPMMWRGGWGWGGGFGFLQCLIPLVFLFLFFGLLRMLFWRGPWGWRRGWGGPGGPGHMGWDREKGYPPMFEEWHRKMHEGETQKAEGGKQ